MIKIDTDFNLNVLLNLFFSLSKKIIFSSPILANNNLPLKIYCENIAISFPIFFSFFPFFFPLFFYPPRTWCRISFFPFFFSSTHIPLHFYFFTSFLFCNLPLPPNSEHSSSPSSSFFFFFFLSSFLPLLKIYPYSYLFYPSFLYFSFTFFWSLFFPEHSIDS